MIRLITLILTSFVTLSHSYANSNTCNGALVADSTIEVFQPDGTTYIVDYNDNRIEVKKATAQFPSGKSTVLLDKPVAKPPMSSSQLKDILGLEGYKVKHEISDDPAVNCHGLSCLETGIPGFPKNAWINPKDFGVILKDYFTSTGIRYTDSEFKEFRSNVNIHDGDLVIMLNSLRRLNHSGIVRPVLKNGRTENWVLSKLDEGLVVLTPIENLVHHYQIATVSIYRKK